ncbi:hypothetical protein [Acanthopleuribacter pedis]|uniref:Uncharacterized protein n=1 Tax=Acanthopleuribacter pedis TaxID=442870 RepID=A0A8J7U3U0_9BACT|nr:hypothetical protein [Acanthopleuribacter pedis]MBO1319952.1 hypothetical protein [Acanthopleuribacter pedis]
MRRLSKLALCVFWMGMSVPMWAQLHDSSIKLKLGYLDQYMYRGRLLHDDAVYQGQFTLGISRWSYDAIYNEAADPAIDGFERETTHNISFTSIVNNNTVSTIGYQYSDFQGGMSDSQEFFVRFARSGGWNPSYGIAFDIDAFRGYYGDFALNRLMPISRRTVLSGTLKTALAFDMEPEIEEESGEVVEEGLFGKDGFVHSYFQLNVTYTFSRWFKLDFGGRYHFAHDDTLFEDRLGEEDEIVGYANVTISLQ